MSFNIPTLFYTHSSYEDVAFPAIMEFKKYFKDASPLLVCSERALRSNLEFGQLLYDDKLSYTERLCSCIKSVNSDFILFLHEDMLLYSYVNVDMLNKGLSFLRNNSQYHYLRLFRTVNTLNRPVVPELGIYECDNWHYAVQPTIIRKETFQKMFCSLDCNIWQLEEISQGFCPANNMRGLFYYNNEPKRGMSHYDSSVFPFVATAIVKGKWNLSEYPKEIQAFADKFFIDLSVRGVR